MAKEISAIYNKTTVFRNASYKRYSYRSIIAIKNEKDATVHLDAKEGTEIKQAISDSIRYLNTFGLEKLPLTFNGVEVMVYLNSDEYKLLISYLRKFEEFKKSINQSSIS